MEMAPPNPSRSGATRRRVKVTTACDPCRTRKSACDGRRPMCSPCGNRHGQTALCVWTPKAGSRGVAAARLMQIERRIADLEGQRLHVGNPEEPPGTDLSPLTDESMDADSATSAYRPHSPTMIVQSATSTTFSGASFGQLGHEIDVTINRFSNLGFFGTASFQSLVANIHQWENTDSRTTASQRHPFREGSIPHSHDNIDHRMILHKLPPKDKTDRLLHLYWSKFHPIFPVLHQDETQNAYDNLWKGAAAFARNDLFLHIISIILALSTRMDDEIPPGTQEDVSRGYLQLAYEFYDSRSEGKPCLESVQAFLLLGEYFHSLNPQQCWLYVGLAIRAAQSLGLHLVRLSVAMASDAARELVHRVWHVCVVWDRILGMTYGRTTMISHSDACALPWPQPMTYDVQSTQMNSFESSDFLAKACTLWEVVAGALDRFSTIDLGDTQDNGEGAKIPKDSTLNMIQIALVQDRALSDWLSTLPQNLTLERVAEVSPVIARQATVLHQRFLQARIVVFRPVLSSLLRNRERRTDARRDHSSLIHEIAIRSAVACIATAQEAIGTITQYGWTSEGCETGLLNHWWNNILYLYNAGTLLIAGRLCHLYPDQVSDSAVALSTDLLKQALQRYERHGQSVRSVLDLLTALEGRAQRMLDDRLSDQREIRNAAVDVSQAGIQGTTNHGMFSTDAGFVQSLSDPTNSSVTEGFANFLWPFSDSFGSLSFDHETFGL